MIKRKIYQEYFKDETKIMSWSGDKIQIYDLYEKRQLNSKDYPLEAEVKSGLYLSKAGELEALSKKEWLEKKEEYKKALAEANE